GVSSSGKPIRTFEIYDPTSDTMTSTASIDPAELAFVYSASTEYEPGENVALTGSGWRPKEKVLLLFDESPLQHAPHVYSAIADSQGRIADSDYVFTPHDLGTKFMLSARGHESGLSAVAPF